jgi:nucleoside-diphosphate-sugar epimerase
MLLITGGTGFIGSRFAQKLIQSDHAVRILLRPQKSSPRLPRNVSLEIAVSSLQDQRSLRAALKNVKTIFHFATAEHHLPVADYESVDIQGTKNLMEAAKDAGVEQVLFLSRVGAEQKSFYPVLKSKALAEEIIRSSDIPYSIIRLTEVFGNNDHFTSQIQAAIQHSPLIIPIPGDGKINLQPLWIEDLLTCLMLIYEENIFDNRTYEIGGGEYYSFNSLLKLMMERNHKKRLVVPISPAYLRLYNLWFQQYKDSFPLSTLWLDLLAVDRTCPLNSLARSFGMLPARFTHHLDYLEKK